MGLESEREREIRGQGNREMEREREIRGWWFRDKNTNIILGVMGLQRKMERDLQRDTKIGEQGLWKKRRDIGGYDFIEGEIDCRLKVQKEREILTVRGQREKEIKGQGLETKREILSVRVYRERDILGVSYQIERQK